MQRFQVALGRDFGYTASFQLLELAEPLITRSHHLADLWESQYFGRPRRYCLQIK